jgi:hypothetical protein
VRNKELISLIGEREARTGEDLDKKRVFKNKGEEGNETVGFQNEEEKNNIIGIRKNLVRNVGIENILGEIVEENKNRRDLWWHGDGLGMDLVFNKKEAGDLVYFDFVSVRVEGGFVKVNGEKVEYSFVNKLKEAVVNPRRGVM